MFYNPYHTRQYSPFDRALAQERALAQQQALQRARRAQYLPYEDESDDDEYYTPRQLNPRESMYLQAVRQKEEMERRRREEEARYQQRLEAQRQEQLRREMLLRQYMNSANPESVRRERPQPGPRHSYQHPVQTKPTSPAPSEPMRIRIRTPSPARSTAASEVAPAETTQTPPSPTPSSPQHSPEARDEAALKIQTFYRAHRSLRTIHDLAHEFNILKSSFVLPTTLDFQGPDHIITVSSSPSQPSSTPLDSSDEHTPKLAYTTTNFTLHAYVEALNRLLVKLDGVQSWGEARVREERRRVVRQIETEANDVEMYWKGVWTAHTLKAVQEAKVEVEDSEERETTEEEEMPDADADSLEVQPIVVDSAPSDPVQEDTDMEAREEETQQPEVNLEADPAEEQPVIVDPASSDTQDVPAELPQLVTQEDDSEMDSDDTDISEVEDIMVPEEDVVPVAVADPELDPSPRVDASLVVPPSKADEVVSEELGGGFRDGVALWSGTI